MSNQLNHNESLLNLLGMRWRYFESAPKAATVAEVKVYESYVVAKIITKIFFEVSESSQKLL